MKRASLNSVAIVVGFLGLLLNAAGAAEWGSIKGRFVIDGMAPTPERLVVTKDQHCIDAKPVNETVVVGKDGGLVNVVVFIRLPRNGKVSVHPDYEAKLKEPVKLDNNGCSFKPHVSLVRVGQPFVITNSDPVGHNTKAQLVQNASFNVIVAQGQENKLTFTKVEPMPMPVNCNIHPWMQGHVLVQDHPYMAVSADDGTFEIANVPAGKHEFQLWHEAAGYLKNLKYKGGTADRRGRATLTIAAGQTLDLGDIKVAASSLK
jgi:plastocyanin